MVENICKQCDQQRIDLQNLQTALVTKYPKNNPIKKWAEDLQRFFQRRHKDGQETHEKMFNGVSY